MSFLDELKKLTQPYDDENDVFDGADLEAAGAASSSSISFTSSFDTPEDEEKLFEEEENAQAEYAAQQQAPQSQAAGPFAGILGKRSRQVAQEFVSPEASQLNLVLFAPDSLNAACGLAEHLKSGRSVLVNLEGLSPDVSRRVLDFISGIAYALECPIKQFNGKTYLVTPANVNIIGS